MIHTPFYCAVRNPYGYLTVSFSPQILLYGDSGRCNTKPLLSRSKIQRAVSRLGKRMARGGIYLDLMGATISRIDLFSDLSVSSGYSKIVPALMKIRLPHLRKPRGYQGKGSTTIYYSNGCREICVYDKVRELLDKEILSETIATQRRLVPDRHVRVEYRLRSPRVIRTSLGISTLRDLLKGRQTFEGLRGVYNHVTFSIRQALGFSPEPHFAAIPVPRAAFPVRRSSNPFQKRLKPMERLDLATLELSLSLFILLFFPTYPPRGPPLNRDVWGREASLQYAVAAEIPGLSKGAGI